MAALDERIGALESLVEELETPFAWAAGVSPGRRVALRFADGAEVTLYSKKRFDRATTLDELRVRFANGEGKVLLDRFLTFE